MDLTSGAMMAVWAKRPIALKISSQGPYAALWSAMLVVYGQELLRGPSTPQGVCLLGDGVVITSVTCCDGVADTETTCRAASAIIDE